MSVAEKYSTLIEKIPQVYDAGYQISQNKPYINTGEGVRHHEYLFISNRYLNQIDKFDLSNITNSAYMFQNASELITCPVVDTSKASRMLYMYYNCPYLKTIEGIDFSSCTNATNAFYNCRSLEEIVVHGTIPVSINFSSCPFIKASFENIIDCLSSTATGQTATFNKAAKEAAFTEDEWNALIATKPNWGFAYA